MDNFPSSAALRLALIVTRPPPDDIADWKQAKQEIPNEAKSAQNQTKTINEEAKREESKNTVEESSSAPADPSSVVSDWSLPSTGRARSRAFSLSSPGRRSLLQKDLDPISKSMSRPKSFGLSALAVAVPESLSEDLLASVSGDGEDSSDGEDLTEFDCSLVDLRSTAASLLDYLALIGAINDAQCEQLSAVFQSRDIASVAAIAQIKSSELDQWASDSAAPDALPRATKRILRQIIKSLSIAADEENPADSSKNEEARDSTGSSDPFAQDSSRSRTVSSLLTRHRSSKVDLLNSVVQAEAEQAGSDEEVEGSTIDLDDPSLVTFPVSKVANSAPNRVLCFSSSEIWLCRGSSLLRSYSLSDVFCFTPQEEQQSFSISFLTDGDLSFFSPDVARIHQEINERLATRKSQEKTALANRLRQPSNAESYQRQMHRESQSMPNQSSEAAAEAEGDAAVPAALSPRSAAAPPSTKRPGNKVEQLTGKSESQLVESTVQELITDKATDEGRARLKFLKTWPLIRKKPNTALAAIRQFMDSLFAFIQRKRFDALRKLAPKLSEEDLLRHIERGIESAIVAPLYDKILEVMKDKEKDETKTSEFRSRSQSWFGVSGEFRSSHNWAEAVRHLSLSDRKFLPADKLDCILNTARAIYHDHLNTASEGKGKPKTLSADDFFPIFVFVLSRASIQSPDLTKQFCWELCSKDALNGEGGYYLTVFEAAVEYLKAEMKKNGESASSSGETE